MIRLHSKHSIFLRGRPNERWQHSYVPDMQNSNMEISVAGSSCCPHTIEILITLLNLGLSKSFEVDGLVVKVSGQFRDILFKKCHP